MYIIYEGNITPNIPLPSSTGFTAGIFSIPRDCVYLNIYNVSPHRLAFSFGGGEPDWYFPPNSEAEGIYLGVQTGARDLNLRPTNQVTSNLKITNIYFSPALSNVSGTLAIMGFTERELWQGKRPLITGSVVPAPAANVASSIINNGNPDGTPIITSSATPGTGAWTMYNGGSITGQLQSFFGSLITFLQSINEGVGHDPLYQFGIATAPSTTSAQWLGFFNSLTLWYNSTVNPQRPITFSDSNTGHFWYIQFDSSNNLILNDFTDGKTYTFQTNGIFNSLTDVVTNSAAASLPAVANQGGMTYDATLNALTIFAAQTGASVQGIIFDAWTGVAVLQILSLGTGIGSAKVNIDNNGNINGGGWIASGQNNSGAIASNATLTTTNVGSTRCQPAAAVTGIILSVGSVRNQEFTVFNESVAANSITFAAQATSHVAAGASVVIAGLQKQTFKWNAGTSLWY